jgi:hypothetical protein
VLAGLAVSIYAAATAAPPGGVSGTVLDALTGRPVRGAVVSDGKKAVALTDSTGQFQLRDLADGAVDVIVEHPEYIIFARPAVPVGNRVVIRLQPASIKAEPVEIVETREEELRPMLRAQAPFKFPIEFEFLNRGKQLKGVYRVCVGKDGHISLVAALDPAGAADPYVKEGIAQGWEYKPLSKPACFFWRVTLNFNYNATIMKPPARIEQSVPRGPEIQPK